MSPPGDYIADVSEGITRPEDLPAPHWNSTVATTQGVAALAVATAPAATVSPAVASTTSATPVTAVLSTSSSCSPSIGA